MFMVFECFLVFCVADNCTVEYAVILVLLDAPESVTYTVYFTYLQCSVVCNQISFRPR